MSILWHLRLTLVAVFLGRVDAKLLSSPAELTNYIYDFVIVGAGTAGSVLANRLTEDPNISVLVVEAGGSDEGVVGLECPFLAPSLPGTEADWNYTTVVQGGLGGRSIGYPRGHVLGGSSSINYMTYNRGSNDIWNNWANVTDDDGWSWKSVEKYYLKSSRLVPSADSHNTTGQVNPLFHGYGPVEVSAPNFPTILDNYVVSAGRQLGGRFSYNGDVNSGNPLGTGYMQTSIGKGQRSSSATAYLHPVQQRSNLDILIATHVTKIIPSSSSGHVNLVFDAVEVAQSTVGKHYQIHATKEVILSAGTIGTPQILLLSGIGPKAAVEKLGIPSLVDLPDVGQHLADHPFLTVYYHVNTTKTYDDILRNSTLFNDELEKWIKTHRGPLTIPAGNTQIFLKLPTESSAYKQYGDPSSGPNAANLHIVWGDEFGSITTIPQPPTGHFITAFTAVFSPLSRGSVSLQSVDPFIQPLIDPGVYTNGYDIEAMVQAIKEIQDNTRSIIWDGFVIGLYGLEDGMTDEELATYARKNSITYDHPVGTARMSPLAADWGVVDPKLLVKKTLGLRVVDASVFPQIPETHTMATVYTLAERAADLVKEAHGLTSVGS